MRRRIGVLLALGLILASTPVQTVTETEVEVTAPLWEKIPEDPTPQVGVFERTHEVICNEFTLAEADLLMRVAEAEAGNQGSDGMWLVMSVVFNRVQDPAYPSCITDVIYQPHQFSTVSNGSINRVEISADAHEALARLEMGNVAPHVIGFETTASDELDKYFTEVFTHRDHKFYVAKER